MALTVNLKRTGAAAHADALQWREMQEQIIRERQLDFGDALNALKEADPAGWEAWFDDDANIPPLVPWNDGATIRTLIQRMEARRMEVLSETSGTDCGGDDDRAGRAAERGPGRAALPGGRAGGTGVHAAMVAESEAA